MKISLLIPRNNFLELLKPELEKLGHTVLVNNATPDCDVIIGMSISQIGNIANAKAMFPKVPLVLYNWDWYDHLDKTVGDWKDFTDLMRDCKEVWSASEITSIKCERDTGIKSPAWFYVYILPDEWVKGEYRDKGYILQASRQDSYKRFDWFERAATELGIPFKSYHPGVNSRPDYIEAVKNCSFLVVSSREESLGTLSALEAGYCFKPVLIADFEGAKEVWKNKAHYFPKDDYETYKAKMKWLWENRTSQAVKLQSFQARQMIHENFLPSVFAKRISDRLTQIL